jgi:hypothetical protein
MCFNTVFFYKNEEKKLETNVCFVGLLRSFSLFHLVFH